jgi:hypothetical protein
MQYEVTAIGLDPQTGAVIKVKVLRVEQVL